jgi:hypothetical protein
MPVKASTWATPSTESRPHSAWSIFFQRSSISVAEMMGLHRARRLQGWPKRSKLAQDFDCKPLLTASSWPNFWANPVNFTLWLQTHNSATSEVVR